MVGLTLSGIIAFCAGASAQVAVYGMGSGGYLSSVNSGIGPQTLPSSSLSAYGGTFGVYDSFLHLGPIHLGGDARGFVQSSSNNNPYGNQLRGGLVGARASFFSHFVPFSPYVQAEVGGVATNYGTQPQRTTSLAYQVQGGLDFTIFPRIDARAEYGAGQIGGLYSGTQQTMQQIGIGFVVRLF